MEKKKKENSLDKQANMELLKDLRKMAMKMISEGLGEDEVDSMDEMKKVTVAAKDEEGLKKGLEKAEDMLESMPSEESEESEESEDDKEEVAEASSEEEQIAELEAKLAALKAKKQKA